MKLLVSNSNIYLLSRISHHKSNPAPKSILPPSPAMVVLEVWLPLPHDAHGALPQHRLFEKCFGSAIICRNQWPAGMVKTLWIVGESSSLVVQDFVHQHYDVAIFLLLNLWWPQICVCALLEVKLSHCNIYKLHLATTPKKQVAKESAPIHGLLRFVAFTPPTGAPPLMPMRA